MRDLTICNEWLQELQEQWRHPVGMVHPKPLIIGKSNNGGAT